MAQRPVLPLGSGLGQIKAESLQGDANEAAFMNQTGALQKLFGMYPTQAEAIAARKRAQEGIVSMLNQVGGGSIGMGMPDDSLNIAPSTPQTRSIGSVLSDLFGSSIADKKIGQAHPLNTVFGAGKNVSSINELDIFSPDGAAGIAGQRMPLTGGGDQPGDATFGGRIPEDVDASDDTVETTADIDDDGDVTTGAGTIGPRLEDADAADTGIRTRSEDLDAFVAEGKTGQSKTDPEDPFAAALADAMKSYEDAKSGKNTEKKDIDYYKQQFADATGIDVSGKVDKSQALMAFGLALMQNKAGKGFDVGRILGEVGAAGEKAMPELSKARSEARAAQLAGGKYALNQVASDKAAEAAILAEKRDNIQEIRKLQMSALADSALAQQQHMLDMDKQRLENQGKVAEQAAKSRVELEKLANEFSSEKAFTPVEAKKNITMHVANRKSDGAEIFTKPLSDVPLIAKGYADSLDGTASVDRMIDLLTDASAASAGGLAGQQLFEFVQNRAAAFGLNMLEDENGKVVGPVTEANAIKSRLIAQYKRFLTQETGNGISDTDVRRLADSLGEVDFFTNPQQAITRLRETRKIFESSTEAFQRALVQYSDRGMYFNDEIFEKTQKKLQEAATGALYEGLGTESVNMIKDPDTGITTIKLS